MYPVAALDGLRVALPHLEHDDLAHRLDQQVDRRIAVAGDVLDARAEVVRVAHAEQDSATDGVRHGHQLPREGCGEVLLELQRRAFTLLKENVDVARLHLTPLRLTAPSSARGAPGTEPPEA